MSGEITFSAQSDWGKPIFAFIFSKTENFTKVIVLDDDYELTDEGEIKLKEKYGKEESSEKTSSEG